MAKFKFKPLKEKIVTASRRAITDAFYGDGVASGRLAASLGRGFATLAELFTDSYHFSFANLVPNGSFEVQADNNSPPDGWNLGDGTVWKVDVDLVASEASGNNSLQFTSAGKLTSDKVVIEGGKIHRASLTMEFGGTLGAGDGVNLLINEYERDGTFVQTQSVAQASSGFALIQDLQGTFTTDSDTRYVEFEISVNLGGFGASNPTVTIDHISVPNRIVSGLNDFRHTMAYGYLSSSLTNINGDLDPVPWDATHYDYGTAIQGVLNTSTGVATIPETGLYDLHVNVRTNRIGTSRTVRFRFEVNDGSGYDIIAVKEHDNPTAGDQGFDLTVLGYPLFEGDLVKVVLATNDVDWDMLGIAAGYRSYFSIRKASDQLS